jgi:predicted amidohydrolase YtcJ
MAGMADLILRDASVLTLGAERPSAELVAVKDGRIIRVGSNDAASELQGPATETVDCQGKTLIPGLNDAHCHIFAFASSLLSVDCSPASVASIGDMKARIRARARKAPTGSWIRATGYNEFYLAEGRHPNRWDLDEAAPHHPVKLVHRSRHACVLNSLGLSQVGISIDSPEPPEAMIDRDLDSGEPNGLLFEMDSYLDKRIPPVSREEFEEGVRLASEQYLSWGITSLQDATVHNGLNEWRTFQGLRKQGLLVPRVSMMCGLDGLRELRDNGFSPRYGDDGLRLGALKVMLTEAAGSMHPGQEDLNREVLEAHRAGYQVAIHAVEESTVEAAAQAIENAVNRVAARCHRHRIEHCSVCPPALLERLKVIHAIVVTNPSFVFYSGERYLKTVPEGQQRWLYRLRSFLETGLRPAAGSDSPIAPVNPFAGIYAAVTRKADNGNTVVPDERVSPLEALGMYTGNAAYASFDEPAKGSIAVGKLADLALLSADPTQVPPDEIRGIQVEMTIAGGKIVWPSG